MTPPFILTRKSSLRLLFSTDYSQMLTTRLLRTGYRLAIAVTVFTVLIWAWIAASLPTWIGWGIPALIYIFAPFLGLVWLSALRILFEYLIVIFGISEKVHGLDAKVEYLARTTYETRKETTNDGTQTQTHPTPHDETPHDQSAPKEGPAGHPAERPAER